MTSCWSCGQPPGDRHFCKACGKIQPIAPGEDYFSFLGWPRRLDINAVALEQIFHELSRKFHPDFYQLRSSDERRASVARSSMLNDAYRTLRDPITRLQYLLEVEGRGRERHARPPADLLEEVFELNMQLDEIRQATDTGLDGQVELLRQSVEQIAARIESKRDALEREREQLVRDWDQLIDQNGESAARPQVLDRIEQFLSQWSYVRNLLSSIKEYRAQ